MDPSASFFKTILRGEGESNQNLAWAATSRALFQRQHRGPEDEENLASTALQTPNPTNAPPPVISGSDKGTQYTLQPEGMNLTWKIGLHGIDDGSAPNISLNLHRSSKRGELYAAALFGIVLQFGMLVFCGFSVYHQEFSKRFPKNGLPVQAYAFRIMAPGTILLMVGMLICSAVVEQSTVETEYLRQRENTNDIRLLWLQKSHTVSDQAFDSFALGQPPGRRDRILTSRRQGNGRTRATNPADATNPTDVTNPTDETNPAGATNPADATNPTDAANPASATNPADATNLTDPTNHLVYRVKMRMKTIASNRTEGFTLLGVFFGLSGFILQFQVWMAWSAR